jgi:hypothetical protein
MRNLGYPFFEKGVQNVNTIGIRAARHATTGKPVTDEYIDLIVLAYKDERGQWRVDGHPATTVPGLHYFRNPINQAWGTGVLVPGFYRGVYQLGRHMGLPALQQAGTFRVYRDRNRDGFLDLVDPQECGPECAFNLHYSWGQRNVHNASAGCQVVRYTAQSPEYSALMHLYKCAAARWGNRFSYALLLETDIPQP